MYVFVFGTLMKGYGNHRVMEQAQGKYVGRAVMYGKDMYYAYTKGGFPAIIHGKGKVYGEVYKLPDSEIEFVDWFGQKIKVHPISILDNLEGYNPSREPSHNMYLRKKSKVLLENGTYLWVSYYYWNREVSSKMRINSGDYRRGV